MIESFFNWVRENSDVSIFIYSVFMFCMGYVLRSFTAQDQVQAAYKEAEAIREILHEQIRITAETKSPFNGHTVSYRVSPTTTTYRGGNQA